MRQVLSTALVALIVSALTVTVAGALAQEPAPTTPEEDVVTAGLNADSVDGRHAVKATSKKSQRKNKLVAADAKGYLPSNIVKPKWGLISQKPPAFADGQIGWGEVVGIPAGFADGVDDVGVAGVKLTRVYGSDVPIAGSTGVPNEQSAILDCPPGSKVSGGGASTGGRYMNITSSFPADADTWVVWVTNTGTDQVYFAPYAICMSAEPAGAITTARKSATIAKATKRGR